MMKMKEVFLQDLLWRGMLGIWGKKPFWRPKKRWHKDAMGSTDAPLSNFFTSLELSDAPFFTSIGPFAWPDCLLLHMCLCANERRKRKKERVRVGLSARISEFNWLFWRALSDLGSFKGFLQG